jgi:hypothetical protein
VRKATAQSQRSVFLILLKATREASSRQTWTFPADATAVALALAVTANAVAYLIELAELFDVEMDHLAGLLALISARWLGRSRRSA